MGPSGPQLGCAGAQALAGEENADFVDATALAMPLSPQRPLEGCIFVLCGESSHVCSLLGH